MKYISYTFVFTCYCFFYSIISCEITYNSLPQYYSASAINKEHIAIQYSGDYKIIFCPAGTIFDQDCFVYENIFLSIKNTNENIRTGIVGNAVEKFINIQGIRFYKTKKPITVITKNRSPKIPSKL